MSWIRLPDLHPGRCKNTRTEWVNGNPETLRCLDYEDTEHVCSFPEPPRPLEVGDSFSYQFTETTTPKAWVKP